MMLIRRYVCAAVRPSGGMTAAAENDRKDPDTAAQRTKKQQDLTKSRKKEEKNGKISKKLIADLLKKW